MRRLDLGTIARIAARPLLFLFLDYDGTLTPIVSGPSKARLSPSVRSLLHTLKRSEGIQVAIISGRSLVNLKRFVRVPGLICAGNHGFEMRGPGLSYVHPMALALEPFFATITGKLRRALASFRGIRVEHKTFSVSVHYRQLRSPGRIREARQTLLRELADFKHTPVVLVTGKKVWELRPTAAWHKGKAVLWLLDRVRKGKQRYFPVFVGDDTTDEDAFHAVRKKGVGIKVCTGKKERSLARYYVRGPGEAVRFLRQVLSLRKNARTFDGF
ncbi:MAG: trehalose-phosphatase [Candidatus Omnitrophica bacterium]|nr:trehalose-phosphatase [Candidatus Omnitrophota bacterium]